MLSSGRKLTSCWGRGVWSWRFEQDLEVSGGKKGRPRKRKVRKKKTKEKGTGLARIGSLDGESATACQSLPTGKLPVGRE